MKRRHANISRTGSMCPSSLKVKDLTNLCREMGIKSTATLRKFEMLILVDVYLRESGVPFYDKVNRITFYPPVYLNDEDPVSQESLVHRKADQVFTLTTEGHEIPEKVHRFDPVNMVTMILTTGKSKNPFSQKEMTENDLFRLEYSYFNCLRCCATAPAGLSEFLLMRPDIKRRLIGEYHPLPVGAEESIFPKNFLPWLTRDNIIIMRNASLKREKIRNEVEQTTEYLADMFRKDIQSLKDLLKMYPYHSLSHVQINFTEALVSYFIPSIFDHLHALFVWNVEEGMRAVTLLTDHSDEVINDDEHGYEANVWSYVSTLCIEGAFSFYATYYDENVTEERKAQVLTELAMSMRKYNSRRLLEISMNH